MNRKKKRRSPFSVESRKTEIRYVTSDPKKMLGKFVARRAFHTWLEEVEDEDTGETCKIERNELLLERGTYIDNDQLSSINFMMQTGTLKEVEVSNQNRQGSLLTNTFLSPFKAVANFVEATLDKIQDGNPDVEEEPESKKDNMKFYEIGAHIVRSHEKEGNSESDHTFIVQTVSAVRANMLIEKYLRDKQEEEYEASILNPDRTFVKYDIRSFIETSKIIPIGCFIPVSFSEVYNENDD